ncbi:unnamed protein product [Symbiodinium natans]|uniref:Uncharacterized protein n=1 Tax=Symbiodinium natans TaxID=878477 RepID=A0A812HBX6_9DINO|nr:unnamed protein product [Symbiodinium natans]
MSTIPTERAAVFEVVTSAVKRLRDVLRAGFKALRDREKSTRARAKRKTKMVETFNRRVAQTKIVSSSERVEPLMQEMFSDETFARGVELQDFQLGLIVVEHTGDADLKELQDAFHDRWFQHRQLVEHRIGTSQGLLREEATQADADENLGAAIQEAEAKRLVDTDDDRPTVEDLRWMRLIVKAGGGIFKEKVMPSLGEINDLLRSRQDSSSASSETSER